MLLRTIWLFIAWNWKRKAVQTRQFLYLYQYLLHHNMLHSRRNFTQKWLSVLTKFLYNRSTWFSFVRKHFLQDFTVLQLYIYNSNVRNKNLLWETQFKSQSNPGLWQKVAATTATVWINRTMQDFLLKHIEHDWGHNFNVLKMTHSEDNLHVGAEIRKHRSTLFWDFYAKWELYTHLLAVYTKY